MNDWKKIASLTLFTAAATAAHAEQSITGQRVLVFGSHYAGASFIAVEDIGTQDSLLCYTDANAQFGLTALSAGATAVSVEDGATVTLTCDDNEQLIELSISGGEDGDSGSEDDEDEGD